MTRYAYYHVTLKRKLLEKLTPEEVDGLAIHHVTLRQRMYRPNGVWAVKRIGHTPRSVSFRVRYGWTVPSKIEHVCKL